MDYEKKYKEAQKWIESIYSELSHEQQMKAEAFFPELKENEDERIRKEILQSIRDNMVVIHKDKCIAWLEKQGEQQPSNKVESKFHEGDWVVCEAGEFTSTLQITDIKNGCYWFHDDSYLPVVDEDCLHLWTIGDARDGDVLAVEPIKDCPNSFIAIYKERGLNFFNSYCFVSLDGEFNKGTTGHDIYLIHPATKEQRDTLFAKMKEAGYEWDAEKKELKKISQRMVSAEAKEALYDKLTWSEDDVYNSKLILSTISQDQDLSLETKDKLTSWLKSLRPQPKHEWSEEDEDAIGMAIIALDDMYDPDYPDNTYGGYFMPFNKAVERLKSLKQRIGGEV